MKSVKGSRRSCGLLVLLLGWGLAPAAVQAENLSPESDSAVAVEADRGLDGQDVFQILLGEIALKRGELSIAAGAYADAAQRNGDEALFRRAVHVAVEAQNYELALATARDWVESHPDSATARHALVSVLAGFGHGDEMAPHIERLLALDEAGRPRNLMHLPRLFSTSPPVAALPVLRSLIEPYRNEPEAHWALASVAHLAGEKALALAAVQEASRLRPGWLAAAEVESRLETTPAAAIDVWTRFLGTGQNSEQAYLHRARLQVSANNLVAAREDYESALALNPESVDTIYALALLNTQAGNRPAAEKYFNRLEGREFSGQGMVAYQLGLLAQDRGDIETAQRHFQSVRDGEYYVDARGQLALLLSRQGKNEEARKMLTETSVKSVADRSRLAVAEARILRDSKQFDAAFAVLEKALLAEPNDPVLLYDTAMLAEQLKKQDVVETTLTRLIELQPNHPHAYNALGYSWADRNVRLQEARLLIARALELAPHDPAILDSMGWVLFRLGQPEAALVHLEKAHGLLSDPEIAAHLGEVLWVIGRRDEALRVWSDARLRYPASEVLGAVIDRFRP